MVDLESVTFEVYTETNYGGTRTTTDRKLRPRDDAPEEYTHLITALKALQKKRRGISIRHLLREMGLEDGDTVTLDQIMHATPDGVDDDRLPSFTVEDLHREMRLGQLDPSELAIGTIVKITRMKGNEGVPKEPELGVVRDTSPPTIRTGGRAKISWGGHTWSVLEGRETTRGSRKNIYSAAVGRAGMMGGVYDVQTVPIEEVDSQQLLDKRESILESHDVKQKAEDYTVTTDSTWESSTGESDRSSDLHARVTVEGPALTDPVTIHCRNIWDFGWTATVESDSLDDQTATIVKRAARENSPIPTNTRL